MFSQITVEALIEIPAGTIDKWELNKKTGVIEWEIEGDAPRKVQYLGYPGNYGLIPGTLLLKRQGGDGDPLDILVLGPPVERGQLVPCHIIGVLNLTDRGEQDDKLIAVMRGSPFEDVRSISELDKAFPGVSKIIEVWFENYKGKQIMKSQGYGSVEDARAILQDARVK